MALNMVAKDRPAVDTKVWTHEPTELIRAAAQDPIVTYILVNPAIKKAMCREAGADRSWLSKVRPYRHGERRSYNARIDSAVAAGAFLESSARCGKPCGGHERLLQRPTQRCVCHLVSAARSNSVRTCKWSSVRNGA